MTTSKPCQDQVVVSAELAAAIVAIDGATWDYGVNGVAGEPWPCDLAAAHLGAHMAHVQTTPRDVDYWLRWTGSLDVVMVTEPVCEAVLELAEDDEVFCLLPERHDGPHHSGKHEWTLRDRDLLQRRPPPADLPQ